MLVIGTVATLSRSAEFIDRARDKGAVVAHFDIDTPNEDVLEVGDLVFRGDAAVWLPRLVDKVLGVEV